MYAFLAENNATLNYVFDYFYAIKIECITTLHFKWNLNLSIKLILQAYKSLTFLTVKKN